MPNTNTNTNTNQTPTAKHQDTTTFKDEEVKIVAESFNEPIRQAESLTLFTRVMFIHGTIEVAKARFYVEQMDEQELKELVNDIKEHIEHYFK